MDLLYEDPYANIYLHKTTHSTLEIQRLNFAPSHHFRANLQDALNRRTIAGVYQPQELSLLFKMRRLTDLAEARAWALELA